MLLLPIGHDRQVTKRLPLITFLLITANIIVFIYTETIGSQQNTHKSLALKSLIEFAEAHPEVSLGEQARNRVDRMSDLELDEMEAYVQQDQLMRALQGKAKETINAITLADRAVLDQESKRLSNAFVAAYDDYYGYKFGFIPAFHKSSLLNYVSCMFLHGGFMHLFGNMLFLFLAGIAMEDAWGRIFYSLFYLTAGVVATATHAFTAPDSKIYLVGASGAIAGLMGAFMVRYFKARIKFFYFIFFKAGTFKAPAYVMLPLWIALELKDTFFLTSSEQGGVAFWAHIGGFFFGMIMGAFLYYSGIEKFLTPKKIGRAASFGTGNAIHEAVSHMKEGESEEAVRKLKQRIEAVPTDDKACLALAKIYGELGQRQAEIATSIRLIRMLLQKNQVNEALQAYSGVLETSPADESPLRLPLRDWLILSRHLAERGMPREAAGEFEKLGLAYPGDVMGAEALVKAAEIRMQLGESDYAMNIFAYVKQQPDLDANLLLRIAENVAQLNNLTRGRNAA